MMPQNLEAEASVLGAILLSDALLPRIIERRLSPEDFYREKHSIVFRAMLSLHDDGEPVDHLTLTERLAESGELDLVGGKSGVAVLAADVPAAGNAMHYVDIVKEMSALRALMEVSYEIQAGVEERSADARGLLDRAERAIVGLSKADDSVHFDWEGERERLTKEIWDPPADVFGFEFPFAKIQGAIGGLPRQSMSVIGAWPKHGKSHLLDMTLTHVAEQGYRAILWDLEMKVDHRVGRFLQRDTGIDGRRLDLTRDEKAAKVAALEAMKVEVRPVPRGTPVEEVARDIRLSGCDIAGVDHLHKFSHRDEADMAHISGELVSAAMAADCHVIVAAQLNRRRIVGAARPTPTLGDLRYSAMIEADASSVIFVHREESDEMGLIGDEGMLYVAANRFGETESMNVVFDGDRVMFRQAPSLVSYE